MPLNRRDGLACALFLIGLVACSAPPKLQPQQLTFGGIYGVNSSVYAMVRGADGTTYLGGDFTLVGVATGGGVAVDGARGLPKGAFPKVEGEVRAVIPDGQGGWYIGGLFRSVGGLARQNLAHLSSDSKVDATWTPKIDGPVYALALNGGLVLVGGDFHNVGTTPRRNLAAIDASGSTTNWDPGASNQSSGTDEPSQVYALTVNGSSIFVGGNFTTIGGGAHKNLAVLDNAGTAAGTWVADADGAVRVLLTTATNLYVGGEFGGIQTTLGGTSTELHGLASFTLADGKLDESWNPGLVSIDSGNATVYALAAIGNALYVGGQFKGFASGGGGGGGTAASTVLRSGLAALDATGKVLPNWDPALGFGGDTSPVVYALAASGNTLYVGGKFITVRGTTMTFGAAVDGTSAVPTSWSPGLDGPVEALATRGDTVFIGGHFLGMSAMPRNRLAAIAADGTLTDWSPNIPGGKVSAMAVEGDIIYVGGHFQSIGGQGRANLAAVDKAGVVQAWNPGTSALSNPTNAEVDVMSLAPDAIYVGGYFDKVGSETRTNAAAVDRAGQVTTWNPVELAAMVGGLLVADGEVFCTGVINNSSNPTTYGLFHYTLPSATADWNLAAEADYPWSLALTSQNQTATDGTKKVVKTLLVAGNFTSIGTSGAANLAAIDVETHDLSTVVSVPVLDGTVGALAVADGKAYLVGGFTHATGKGDTEAQERAGAVAFDLTTGALTTWQPDLYQSGSSPWYGGMAPVSGGIDLFGQFTSVDGKIGSGIARVSR